MLNARAQLFDTFFRRVAVGYAHVFPLTARRIIEFGFLLQAFFVLAVFIHLHFMFVRSPITCLDKLRSRWPSEAESQSQSPSLFLTTPEEDLKVIRRNHYAPGDPRTPREPWPQYGVLRVEVIRNPSPKYSLADSYAKQFYGSNLDYSDDLDGPLTDLYSDTTEDTGDPMLTKQSPGPGAGTARTHASSSLGAHYSIPSRYDASWSESVQLLHSLRSMPGYLYACLRDTVELVVRTFSFAPAKTAASGVQLVQPLEVPGSIQLPAMWSLNYIKHNILCAALTHLASLVNSVSSSAMQFCREVPLWLQSFYGPGELHFINLYL
ncbi:unnamed protein product [Echinostoma caproni]|uniref:Membralin n=1 Tax=Echinostoma caproni TaxID=27848 RepID=A0A183B7J2_9TREM|nr:unnamed protein product [Echinostoma caproni]